MDRRVRTVLTILDHEYHRNLVARISLPRRRWSVSLEHFFKHHIRTAIRDYVRRRRLAEGADCSPQRTVRVSEVRARGRFGDRCEFLAGFTANTA